MGRTLIHNNGNMLCAIDCETTGLIAGFHNLIQICVLPLDSFFKPMTGIYPFYHQIKMKRPENVDPEAMRVNQMDLNEVQMKGLDPWDAIDHFEEWVNRLELDPKKKVVPLAQNWAFDKGFILDWLGGSYEHLIDRYARDTMTTSLYLNDRADHQCEPVPFAKSSLRYLCSTLKIENSRAHDALQDCLVTAEVYRRMIGM